MDGIVLVLLFHGCGIVLVAFGFIIILIIILDRPAAAAQQAPGSVWRQLAGATQPAPSGHTE